MNLAIVAKRANIGTSTVAEALEGLKKGQFVVVMDNEDRENEGDLIMPAQLATEESLAFLIRYSSGVICAPLTQDRIEELQLPLMVPNNTEVRKCKFTITVDLKEGTSTGISAADRAATIRALADPNVKANAFNRPGHVFPLLAVDGGVLSRAGHTEAAVDLARLAGCSPAAYICEINDDNGRMLRRPQLETFAATHGLHLITISDLIRYRFSHEKVIQRIGTTSEVMTPFGLCRKVAYKSTFDNQRYDALVVGNIQATGSYIYFVKSSVEGSIESQYALQWLTKNKFNGVLVFVPGYEGLVDVSGELMAKQSIFGMGLQIVQEMGATSATLLATSTPLFDTKGFGIAIERVQILDLA
ncbi:riboflavin biosynthesis protein ribBA [Thraustotheca clavata]|uniref:3,4-dihydroxy-2-butanone-4-phosphate synthase n=1 Tax=Thraustotheca clavata TaxID=74557 RepID=A0A1V9Z706_9STRA|nr:riboflavin biosynthesis protein ribBA [Thraustotheca clavata]